LLNATYEQKLRARCMVVVNKHKKSSSN